ncbi:uncharacterized protein LOC118734118 isoform X1 [Rhagoletis pomonella]|uniref:uncharacterized protein LOC118734118 isoform X1 n=1 Tax=Rhagoletis pomonella TaxID=28610 RepID=UPI00177CE964|nr:uncharacterized protein LOC118734118 isoform X1 [Rhagoletis pomonella]
MRCSAAKMQTPTKDGNLNVILQKSIGVASNEQRLDVLQVTVECSSEEIQKFLSLQNRRRNRRRGGSRGSKRLAVFRRDARVCFAERQLPSPYLLDSGEGEVSMREKSPTPFSSSAAPSTSRSSTSRSRSGTPQLRNRDERFQRLEQHIIRRDHKFKRRVGSLLAVFGQMVQTDYPHINVDSLLVSSESDSD